MLTYLCAAAPAVAGLAAYLLVLGEYPELYQTGKIAENMKTLLTNMAYQRVPDGSQVVFNGQGAVCSRPSSAKFRSHDLSGEACSAVSSTTTLPPTSTSAPPPPATTSNQPAETTAPATPPAPKTLFSLNEEIGAGTQSCFPTTDFTITPGTTYGFCFDVDANLLVSIQTGSTDEGYHPMGPWTGTFYADFGSALSICGTSTASGALPLAFSITKEPSQAVAAPSGGSEVFKLDGKVAACSTTCFPTTGLNIQEGNYSFSYTTADGVVVQIGDDSSEPKYFSGNRAQGAGLMYIDFSGGSISICATNNGGSEEPISLSMTQ